MKIEFILIMVLAASSMFVYSENGPKKGKTQRAVDVIEKSISGGDNLEDVRKIIDAIFEEYTFYDNSHAVIGVDFENEDPLTKKILLDSPVYIIDLTKEIGVKLEFNIKKELCGYVTDFRLGGDCNGLSLGEIRANRQSKITDRGTDK